MQLREVWWQMPRRYGCTQAYSPWSATGVRGAILGCQFLGKGLRSRVDCTLQWPMGRDGSKGSRSQKEAHIPVDRKTRRWLDTPGGFLEHGT